MSEQLLNFSICAGRVWPCPYCVTSHEGIISCVGAPDFGSAKYHNCGFCDDSSVRCDDCPGTKDMVNHPPHYNKAGIEVIDVIEAYAPTNYHLGNVIKYVCRSGHKGHEIEDLKKARWYLDRYISTHE